MLGLWSSSVCFLLLIVQSGRGSEIIGGTEVKPHSMPFMALLRTPPCGGILVSSAWVLTAAHCAGVKEVLLGVHSIKDNENHTRQVRHVTRRVPHPCYDAKDNVNDLMLLKLNKPVKKTKTVKWLQLGKSVRDPAPGSSCAVAGWGKTNNIARKMSDVLMSTNVTVIDRQKCNSPEYYNLKPVITNSMICAGSVGNTRADTCQGDSGGPLLCDGKLVGVTSFGRECGLLKKPGVYSLLSEDKLSWINKAMKKSEIYSDF